MESFYYYLIIMLDAWINNKECL